MPTKDPQARREIHRQWKKKNREKILAQKKRARDRKRGGPPKTKSPYDKTGWNPEMIQTTMAEQGERCAICRQPMKRPCADHKHTSPPEPRGILCNNCNAGIGFLMENPETCRAAAEYLEAWA